MRISIVTVTYNSAITIQDCIKSVNEQSYSDIEHILIDGASTDNTLNLIKSKAKRSPIIISEPDKGIYDAMNKGLALATGEIIGVLNSDDFYLDGNVISNVVQIFNKNKVDAVHGELFYVKQNDTDEIVRHWKTGDYYPGAFQNGWHPAHPTLYLKKEVYEKYGYFNLDFKLAADFELMCRLFEKHNISSYYLQRPLIKMRLGGATSKNFKNVITQNIECYKAFKVNGIPVSPFYIFNRIVPKLKQYF